jgi:hypothetical protein
MLLGTTLPGLIAAGLFPIPQASGYHGSLLDLKDAIYGIRYHHWEGKNALPHQAHTGCNLGLRDSVKKVMEAMDSPIDKPCLDQLSAKAAISGVDNGIALATLESALNPAVAEYVPKSSNSSDDAAVSVKSDGAEEVALVEPENHAGHINPNEQTVTLESDPVENDDSTKPEDEA